MLPSKNVWFETISKNANITIKKVGTNEVYIHTDDNGEQAVVGMDGRKKQQQQMELNRMVNSTKKKIYGDLMPVTWDDVKIGDIVYIDNYENGKFPQANPKVSGPFKVAKGNGCGRWLETLRGQGFVGRGFMNYPNNLLKKA